MGLVFNLLREVARRWAMNYLEERRRRKFFLRVIK